ncbi:MAG: VCBS repeat-containing protein, partial [Candidatus Krumholzibacteriota bacterium]|nr:VCBS repeat-containing protein [Candidatus Krumholzibacteriota bacterium]
AAPAARGDAAEAVYGESVLVDGPHAAGLRVFRTPLDWGAVWYSTDSPDEFRLRLYSGAMLERADFTGGGPAEEVSSPAAAASEDRILVVYAYGHHTTEQRLGAGLFDLAGNILDAEILDADPDLPYRLPVVAHRAGHDEFLVAYTHPSTDAGNPYRLWGLVVSTAGDQISVAAGPVDYAAAASTGALCDLAYGRVEVMPGVYTDRYFLVWSGGGSTWGLSIRVGVGTAAGSAVDLSAGADEGGVPSLAAAWYHNETQLLVAWAYPNLHEVVAQRLLADGTLVGSLIDVAGNAADCAVAAAGDEYLVVYRDLGAPLEEDRLLGRYCSHAGALLGDSFTIVDDDDRQCLDPVAASDGVNYLVGWSTDSPYPDDEDLYVQRVGRGTFTYVAGEVTARDETGRGVAWGDWFAAAGTLPDLYVANAGSDTCRIYKNVAGALTEVLCAPSTTRWTEGAAWGDYDRDGDLDLYIGCHCEPNELYQRVLTLYLFEAVGAAAGVDDAGEARSVIWGDVNADGRPDIYVCNAGSANRLYLNLGGAFVERAHQLGVDDGGLSEGAAFVDFDDDGDLDLHLGNSYSADRLFRNTGVTFVEEAAVWGLADTGPARSVSWCDFDNDGDFDVYVSKYMSNNALYRREGAAFVDRAALFGVDDGQLAQSACWADYDLDGDQDLFLANIGGTDRLFRNDGGAFVDMGAIMGVGDTGWGVGAAWADMDNDGDPDLCVSRYNDHDLLYRNDHAGGNHWLKVRAEGVAADRWGLGARVHVWAGGLHQVQDVGGRNGYLSWNDLVLVFGLGAATAADSVVVRWPGGATDRFLAVTADQLAHLVEGTGTAAGEAPAGRLRLTNWPNPFNPGTRIAFTLSRPGAVTLTVHDARGRRLALLARGEWTAGRHELNWDGRDAAGRALPSGVYVARLQGPDGTAARRLVLLK